MKIIEQIRGFIKEHNVSQFKLGRSVAEELISDFETLETKLLAEKVRSKLFFGMKNNYLSLLHATEDELKITEKLLDDRSRVIKAIPECPPHSDCLPHALDWIEESKIIGEAYDGLVTAYGLLLSENGRLKEYIQHNYRQEEAEKLMAALSGGTNSPNRAREIIKKSAEWRPLSSAPQDGRLFEVKLLNGDILTAKVVTTDIGCERFSNLEVFYGGAYHPYYKVDSILGCRPYV